MSDNPMYWPGHQRPAWHQQPSAAQPVNSIGHYATHPGSMLGNSIAPGIPGDPTSSLQMQSSIPGRHQAPHQSLSQHPSSLGPPPGVQSSLYPSMMTAPGAPGSARPSTQLTPNSHLSSATTQGVPPHPSMQQPTHPQSHYPHQYSSLASPYWNPSQMSSQSSLGPPGAPGPSGSQSTGPQPPPQADGSSTYHSTNASPLSMPNETRSGISANSSASMQQPPAFHSPKDLQSSSDHMMAYDRQRSSLTQSQPQHPSAIMSQSAPSSTASNLSPTQNQMSMQGRLQSQSQLDPMRSMSQQSGASWPTSYYPQPGQSPYSSVMNPYMPYGSSGSIPNHGSSLGQPPTRSPLGPKQAPGSDRTRAAYPPHGASMYGQPPTPAGSTNGGYYGYDSYYNQVPGQAPSDAYLSHPNPGASQHWSSSAQNNQMIGNSSTGPGPIQPPLRPQTASTGAVMHPQSPSAPSTLPLSSRPPPPSQTPDRGQAPQHAPSYPSPNNQGASKSGSNSLAQLEQMVMPGANQGGSTAAVDSPTHRSSANSPNTSAQQQHQQQQQQQQHQQQLQYSYNSSGQGSYFSTGANASGQSGYYPQYESNSTDSQKPGWSEQAPDPMLNSAQHPTGPVMMESNPNTYGQAQYDSGNPYSDYTSLSTPGSSLSQPRFTSHGDSSEPHPTEKGDPYAIDSQTFDDYDDHLTSKTKKGRAKKGDEKVKKERKPRAPRASKGGSAGVPPQSPSAAVLQALPSKTPTLPQTPDMSPAPPQPVSNSFPSPGQLAASTKPVPEVISQAEPAIPPMVANLGASSKSPTPRLSTESPAESSMQPQYSFNSNAHQGYFSPAPGSTPNQSNYYSSQYEQTATESQKTWSDQPIPAVPTPVPVSTVSLPETNQPSFNQAGFDSSSGFDDGVGNKTPLSSFPTSGDIVEAKPTETRDDPTQETQNLDPTVENQTKSKKSRAKKGGDEKAKKERKPRAPKAPKAGLSAAPSSPESSTPVQALSGQSQDGVSTPPPASAGAYSSPNQHSYPAQAMSDVFQKTESLEQNIALGSGQTSRSPSQRLSTESPIAGASTQSQYSFNTTNQSGFYGSAAPPAQSAYYPPYEYRSADGQKPAWSGPPPAGVLSQPMTDGSQVPFASSGYAEYSGEQTTLTYQPAAATDPATVDIQDQATSDTQKPGDGIDSPKPTSKPKKSRSKRPSDDRPKKERKPRVAKTPATQAPAEPPISSPIASAEETLEAPTSQTPTEVPATEAKPKRIRIRDSSSKGKKKLPKFALKFAKTKKRKRLGSSDNEQSDLDKTPPPSPDEDESGVLKRRSARNTKKLKYNDDIELGFSESDDDVPTRPRKTTSANTTLDGDAVGADDTTIADEPTVFAAPVEDTMVVEKIMASRTGKRELEPEPGEVLPPDGTHIEVEEFYVKYKNLSYLHCDWRTLEELEKGDRRVVQKIKRYKQKKDSSSMFSFMDEELFDPQYCEVDRILAVNEVEEMIPDSDDESEKENTSVDQSLPQPSENPEVASETLVVPSVADEQNISAENTEDAQSGPITAGVSEKEVEVKQVEAPVITETVSTDQSLPSDDRPDVGEKTPSVEMEVETGTNDPQAEAPVSDAKVDPTSDQVQVDPPKEEVNLTPVQETEKPRKMKKKISRHYLVKWRGLSYEESTWELEDDLDPEKIKQFERFKDPPPKSKWRTVKRPKPDEWVRKEASPVYKNSNTLREYQLEGINWLSFCWHQGRNCILADEMGLGKTIQSIAFINEIYEHNINGPFLIIVPLSTVGNWAREFETWTDLNVITYHGSSTSREMLKEYEMYYRNEQGNRIMQYYKFQVMITTFEIILSDCLELREIPWRCCIIDEAHRLKNRNCKLLEGLRLLNMEHRVLLTGTPLQNNVEELFSLLNFLEPTQFSSTEQFLQEFGDLKTEAQVDKLKVILKPMMLRRLKEDVEKTLAPKEETIVEVELTNIQKKYYRAILEKNFSFLTKGSSNNNMPNLMNTMMELRKCCIHPYLINGAEDQILYEAKQTKMPDGERMSSHQAMVNSSGKLVLIDKLLPRLKADGHRVLIFSQMVRCLDILEDYVTHKHYPYERIDGRVRGGERQQAIDRFSKPGSDRFVFLLCTRAGGLGINLTAADTVIIFDSDWNPQNDLQAQARCHRIGQSKAVKIYRLICRNTYEREMFDKASLKLGLDKAVLQSMNTQKGGAGGVDGQLTKKEVEELLRKGAYGALMDDDNAGDKFCEEDIDQILQRRTQVITIESSEAKGSTFSKATFSSSGNREDIELDDPNFWEKWAKKANIDADDYNSKDELIQLAPRRRTQTKRYGADGNLLDISDLDSSEEDEETISMRTRGGRNRQTKLTPSSASKRNKRRPFDFDDDDFTTSHDGGYWSKSDCLKVEKGLLTYGWGRWEEIIASNRYKRELTADDCESICRVILLYCLNAYKGDEKIKSFAWELITLIDENSDSQNEGDSNSSNRGRKPKSAPIPHKKSVAEEIADAKWPKEAKNDPLIALPDDQYRRHLQRNSNRLLIRVRFLDYLKNDILKGYGEKILSDCHVREVDLPPVPVDGELPAAWWDDDADKSLLVGIFKHGHDKFNLMRQDPNLNFLERCGPPNKDDLQAEMNYIDKSMDDIEEDNRESSLVKPKIPSKIIKGLDKDAGELLDTLVDDVIRDLSVETEFEKDSATVGPVDENKNSILKYSDSQDGLDETRENGISTDDLDRTSKMDLTDDESITNEAAATSTRSTLSNNACSSVDVGEFLPFPSANDLNQRFRRLITAYQRNSKKLEIQLAQKARDELKKERTSKFEAARNEREERKRLIAQKWSRREEADFFRAISSFGVEYDPSEKRHDWNRFRAIGKLEKKLDETLDEYYKAFVAMCKKVTSRALSNDEENCPISVDPITEERASRCLSRIELLSKIREQIITHPELDQRLKMCHPQSDLPDWWENGKHDKDLLLAAAKHGLTRLDYNLAHDPALSFDSMIREKASHIFSQPPAPILIPIEQLQELLERNGIEYFKDLDLLGDLDDVRVVLNSILDNIEIEEGDGEPTDDAIKNGDESIHAAKTSPKQTRIFSGISYLGSHPLPNILSKRCANTLVKSQSDSTGPNPHSVRLTSLGGSTRTGDRRVVEITPILPAKIPDEPTKTFEAGEISVSIQSESALLQLDDRDPIILFGATNPISAKIRWPKDKAIQTRLENLVSLVEKNEWPSPPRPSIPTITLPNHLANPTMSSNLPISSPAKNDKLEMPGSPKSDISNISSRTSRQDSRERANESLSSLRGRRGRGRRPRQSDSEMPSRDHENPKDDRQAAAKLRNLLSQGPSSSRAQLASSPVGDKLTAKFGGNKQGAGLSSLLASFKQKRSEGSNSSRHQEDKNLLDFSNPNNANLLPQILANMKPEFRDLLSNQEAATMLLNSLSGMGGNNLATNLRSASSSGLNIDNLLNLGRPSKGPPPAHQRSDNPPSAHGSSSTRELRRNSQSTRDNSPPSVNLRSTRGKSSISSIDSMTQKQVEMAHGRTHGKRRGRPSSGSSDSPPSVPGPDVLDLSSLVGDKCSSSARSESRSRRHRDQIDDLPSVSTRSSSTVPTKANLKAGAKQSAAQDVELPSSDDNDRSTRTTRASKRIGSRIDALALNLQAKRMNRGDSPSSDLSPSLPREKESPMAAHGSIQKAVGESKSQSSKAPPAAHSGSHKSSSSGSNVGQSREKNSTPSTKNLPTQPAASTTRQDPLAQLMSNPASLLAGLNPSSMGGANDLMSQMLRKSGTNDIVKNLLNEFMKNPSLALDPNILATLTASVPLGTQGLPGFNLPVSTPTSLPSTSNKSTPTNSLLNDFKPPSGNSLMKRSRQDSSSSSSRPPSVGGVSGNSVSESRRSSSSDRQDRRSSSSGDRRSTSYSDRPEKQSKHDKRSGATSHQEASSDNSSRRSSSSLLAQQLPPNQQVAQTSQSQSMLSSASTLNLANQFGGLNSLSGLLGFPGMNELMKQMSNFPGLTGAMPRVSGAPASTSSAQQSNSPMQTSSSDKGSRRSRHSSGANNGQSATSSQHASNAALANSLMNLASQQGAASNPYGNYTNPLTNPFLPFGLANLGLNNPLSNPLNLFPNLYMPQSFPTPDQQQSSQPPNPTGGSSDGSSKDKKMRYSRK